MSLTESLPFAPSTPLQNRRKVTIVGASSGIGAAMARQLSAEGCNLALLARRSDLLTALCDEINTQAGEVRARAYVHDVNQTETVPALLQTLLADLGGLDVFVYCSGISRPPGLKKYDFNKDLLTLQVNLLGALAWLNPVAELFQSLKGGQIVAISSVAGDRGRVGNPSYNASKAALSSYMESLRNRLTRYGVNVLTAKPGFVETAMLEGAKGTFWAIPAEQAARDICRAMRKRRQDVYSPARWLWVMLVIRNIPSIIFRRLNF